MRTLKLSPAWWRGIAIGAAVAVVAGVLILSTGGDGDREVTAADEASTTTERTTTSSSTSSTTTTEATTTTSPPTTPTTAAPSTTVPATAPPTTTAPGNLDIDDVLRFAKTNRNEAARAPRTTVGADVCSDWKQEASDAGDDVARDIDNWGLTRYCDDVYYAMLSTDDEAPLDVFWVEIDNTTGGCEGVDRIAIGWTSGASRAGALVATPSCAAGTWQWLDAANAPELNGFHLQLDFRGTHISGSSFKWRGFVRAQGEPDGAVDVVPNAGWRVLTKT